MIGQFRQCEPKLSNPELSFNRRFCEELLIYMQHVLIAFQYKAHDISYVAKVENSVIPFTAVQTLPDPIEQFGKNLFCIFRNNL